jgi:hypothetical protein
MILRSSLLLAVHASDSIPLSPSPSLRFCNCSSPPPLNKGVLLVASSWPTSQHGRSEHSIRYLYLTHDCTCNMHLCRRPSLLANYLLTLSSVRL